MPKQKSRKKSAKAAINEAAVAADCVMMGPATVAPPDAAAPTNANATVRKEEKGEKSKAARLDVSSASSNRLLDVSEDFKLASPPVSFILPPDEPPPVTSSPRKESAQDAFFHWKTWAILYDLTVQLGCHDQVFVANLRNTDEAIAQALGRGSSDAVQVHLPGCDAVHDVTVLAWAGTGKKSIGKCEKYPP